MDRESFTSHHIRKGTFRGDACVRSSLGQPIYAWMLHWYVCPRLLQLRHVVKKSFLALRKHKFVTFMFLQFISVFSFRFIHFFYSLQRLAPLLFSHHSSFKKMKNKTISIFKTRLLFRADGISAAPALSQPKKRKHSVLRLNNSKFRLVP